MSLTSHRSGCVTTVNEPGFVVTSHKIINLWGENQQDGNLCLFVCVHRTRSWRRRCGSSTQWPFTEWVSQTSLLFTQTKPLSQKCLILYRLTQMFESASTINKSFFTQNKTLTGETLKRKIIQRSESKLLNGFCSRFGSVVLLVDPPLRVWNEGLPQSWRIRRSFCRVLDFESSTSRGTSWEETHGDDPGHAGDADSADRAGRFTTNWWPQFHTRF